MNMLIFPLMILALTLDVAHKTAYFASRLFSLAHWMLSMCSTCIKQNTCRPSHLFFFFFSPLRVAGHSTRSLPVLSSVGYN